MYIKKENCFLYEVVYKGLYSIYIAYSTTLRYRLYNAPGRESLCNSLSFLFVSFYDVLETVSSVCFIGRNEWNCFFFLHVRFGQQRRQIFAFRPSIRRRPQSISSAAAATRHIKHRSKSAAATPNAVATTASVAATTTTTTTDATEPAAANATTKLVLLGRWNCSQHDGRLDDGPNKFEPFHGPTATTATGTTGHNAAADAATTDSRPANADGQLCYERFPQ